MVNTRHQIESLYRDVADIYTVQTAIDPVTKLKDSSYREFLMGVPCKLSIKSQFITSDGDVALTQQVIKLFMAPEHDIPSGSRILVHHFGRDMRFEQSGLPAIYPDHQEVTLVYSEWA